MSSKVIQGNNARKIQVFLVDLSLTIAGVCSLGGGLLSIYRESAALTATCMGTGLVLLFAATINRFEFLKGLGMEAKVRKLDATIDDAQVKLAQLKDLTEAISPPIISLSSGAGRWDAAPSIDEAHATAKRVEKALKAAGSSEDKVREVLLPWVKTEIGDLAFVGIKPYQFAADEIAKSLREEREALGSPITAAIMPAYDELSRRLRVLTDHDHGKRRSVRLWDIADVTSNLKRIISDSPEVSEVKKMSLLNDLQIFIDEIDYFQEHFEYRDIDFWRKHSRQEGG